MVLGHPEPLVAQALHLLEPEFAQRGVALHFDARAQPPVRVRADPVALEQIVHNLILNALQALERGPRDGRRLAIAVGSDGTEGVLAVSDNGSQMIAGQTRNSMAMVAMPRGVSDGLCGRGS